VQFDGRLVDDAELHRLTDRLAHRGPDGAGYRLFGRAGLGHRRLAIIDLAGGAQPLGNEDGSVWVSFNGEIYNYQDLQQQLEARGHVFRTRSDTEVIVHAYEEWGEACVEHFRGMFAFAIWDDTRQTLFLARDRLGIKPLVYWHTQQRFCFASELQALEELDVPPRSVDLEAIDYYLELLYIPSPRTIYQGVCKLPPAHTLTLSADGRVSLHRYWALHFNTEQDRPAQEWLERVQGALEEAVRLHLIADVPVGALLSAGLDSSTVVAVMSRVQPTSPHTFTIALEDDEYNEAPGAREVASLLSTEHYQQLVHLDAQQLLPTIVRHHGEPFADSSAVPTFAVCALARQHVKVALSGDGGDEAFAGYPWLLGLMDQFELPSRSVGTTLKRLVRRALRGWPWLQDQIDPLRLLQRVRSCFDGRGRRELWRARWAVVARERPSLLVPTLPELRGLDLCAQVQLLDYRWYLPDDVLAKVDIASMCHGLEVRVPLLDHCLVELAAHLPAALKYRARDNGQPGGTVGKHVLRQILGRYLPPAVANRPKKGFGLPLHRWRATVDNERLRKNLLHPQSRLGELFEPSRLSQLLQAAGGGKVGSQLWSVVVLAEWFRQHPSVQLSLN
jgi:asparagine synthase (glutamine-hydrolysing)